ncbi:class I SAM-dependent methyltransferase [Streptomyces roseochromogenus]|uniref:Uncharacterized protein n=1 Tax=Streptomyces roseochromogenus subsp. oscitans DS 12.976 TaxID=1352936 RepID=V6L2S9_STRRC|nr:class I SAM-dependent methyltransferase [Streptomyces roseochromogenus]EST35539.1 hypothetical protein M878_05620 [Streptomyces roseochromogenus subsp. oscitans DS 12.976]
MLDASSVAMAVSRVIDNATLVASLPRRPVAVARAQRADPAPRLLRGSGPVGGAGDGRVAASAVAARAVSAMTAQAASAPVVRMESPAGLTAQQPRLDRPLDAAVSTTALHYLTPDSLRRAYRQLAGLLRPGGVLVNGDHLPQDEAGLAGISAHIGRRRAERQRVFAHEDWSSWRTAVAEDPELADLLRQAGFGSAGAVWQYGDSYVVVGINRV